MSMLIFSAFFSCSPKPDACLQIKDNKDRVRVNSSVHLISCSVNARKYNWDFGDGNIYKNADAQVRHTFRETGTYTITLEVTNGSKKSTATETIVVY